MVHGSLSGALGLHNRLRPVVGCHVLHRLGAGHNRSVRVAVAVGCGRVGRISMLREDFRDRVSARQAGFTKRYLEFRHEDRSGSGCPCWRAPDRCLWMAYDVLCAGRQRRGVFDPLVHLGTAIGSEASRPSGLDFDPRRPELPRHFAQRRCVGDVSGSMLATTTPISSD